MKIFDEVWKRVVKVGGFILGAYIMYHEAIYDHSDRPYLYAAALAMMGSQGAETFGKLLDAASTFFSSRKGISAPGDIKDDKHNLNRG